MAFKCVLGWFSFLCCCCCFSLVRLSCLWRRSRPSGIVTCRATANQISLSHFTKRHFNPFMYEYCFHIPWGWHEKQHNWNKTRSYELHKMKKRKKIKRLWEREDVEEDPGSLCTKRGPCIQPTDKKREVLEVSHPDFSTILDSAHM